MQVVYKWTIIEENAGNSSSNLFHVCSSCGKWFTRLEPKEPHIPTVWGLRSADDADDDAADDADDDADDDDVDDDAADDADDDADDADDDAADDAADDADVDDDDAADDADDDDVDDDDADDAHWVCSGMSSASSVYRRLVALHLQKFAFFTSLTPILVLGIGLVRSSTYAYPMSICRLLPRLSARQHGFYFKPQPVSTQSFLASL